MLREAQVPVSPIPPAFGKVQAVQADKGGRVPHHVRDDPPNDRQGVDTCGKVKPPVGDNVVRRPENAIDHSGLADRPVTHLSGKHRRARRGR